MLDMTINYDDIEDAAIFKQSEVLESIWDCASGIIKSGGIVKIQQEYINSPPDLIKIIRTLDELQLARKQYSERYNVK